MNALVARIGMRVETDSLGHVDVPEEAYFGAQTARAIDNFQISGVPISNYPELIRALGLIKKAAALANARLGDLPEHKTSAIAAACDDVISGALLDAFPVDVFQGGAGTSTNMNANEVIANRALEILGLPRGRYDVIHPNDDVNLSQSTNDVYPTAIRLAIIFSQEKLRTALGALADEFGKRGEEFRAVLKLGRTQLQDAVPMTLGQEFSAYATTLREDVARLGELAMLFREINLGGTAIGTGINADPRYQAIVVEELSRLSDLHLVPARDLIEASWDTGAFVLFSGMLKRTASKLSKISNDLRLLASGPRGGIAEITLPPLQAGSSIMPGKVNPVVPEVVSQVAFHVIGADVAVTMAAEAGQLQLNAMEPLIASTMLHSLALLTNAADALRTRCVAGIVANDSQCRDHLEASMAAATALTPLIGYERAADLANKALMGGHTLRQVLAASPGDTREAITVLDDLLPLTEPGRARVRKGGPAS